LPDDEQASSAPQPHGANRGAGKGIETAPPGPCERAGCRQICADLDPTDIAQDVPDGRPDDRNRAIWIGRDDGRLVWVVTSEQEASGLFLEERNVEVRGDIRSNDQDAGNDGRQPDNAYPDELPAPPRSRGNDRRQHRE
jgi:hypothetical protein